MDRTVYFADKAVVFTEKTPGGGWYALMPADEKDLSPAKVAKILETHNCVAVITSDPQRTFETFASGFALVEAAGGVVLNGRGEWLMIGRNGRWDLPKGHVEPAETTETAAVREIAEETGVSADIVRPLCRTLHAYYFAKTGRWELKRTHWYELRAVSAGKLVPQTEEGIERVAWCLPAEVDANLQNAFPTIRRVAEAMRR
ncbi:NUDIX hydrolase [uncultured Alistipes sp.]|jgi:hypothetical protein|uniref:NUDIX domain-containing protein n=1 Tax=uncultured Alistipes sp. TaxID=538949 RepID=UPI0025F413A4|nr:NUDIX hydrolase [uncultured Alistipes sp.]